MYVGRMDLFAILSLLWTSRVSHLFRSLVSLTVLCNFQYITLIYLLLDLFVSFNFLEWCKLYWIFNFNCHVFTDNLWEYNQVLLYLMLTLLISSRSCFDRFLGIFYVDHHVICKLDSFIYFFPIYMPFISCFFHAG